MQPGLGCSSEPPPKLPIPPRLLMQERQDCRPVRRSQLGLFYCGQHVQRDQRHGVQHMPPATTHRRHRSMVKAFGSAPARLLCLLRARLAALGCVHSRWGHGQAATDSGSRKNSLQSYRFHCLCPPRHRHLARACLSAWPQCPSLIRLVPHVGSCDSSRLPHGVPGSSDRLGASQKEAGQLSALPLPRLLEL